MESQPIPALLEDMIVGMNFHRKILGMAPMTPIEVAEVIRSYSDPVPPPVVRGARRNRHSA